jgi:hypothetical protein
MWDKPSIVVIRSEVMKHCIVCKKETEPLIPINVRKEGQIVIRKFVHAECYSNNEEWVRKQVHGKNPKFFVMGQKL